MTIAQIMHALTPPEQAGNVQSLPLDVADRYLVGVRQRRAKWLQQQMRGR